MLPLRRSRAILAACGGGDFMGSGDAPSRSELGEEFFLLINVAVGGNLPGSPDGTSSFPQQMLVDYVRVYLAR